MGRRVARPGLPYKLLSGASPSAFTHDHCFQLFTQYTTPLRGHCLPFRFAWPPPWAEIHPRRRSIKNTRARIVLLRIGGPKATRSVSLIRLREVLRETRRKATWRKRNTWREYLQTFAWPKVLNIYHRIILLYYLTILFDQNKPIELYLFFKRVGYINKYH